MKIIEIRNTTYGEVAYVYDEYKGKIIKVLVEDQTGVSDYNDFEEQPQETVIRPVRKIKRRIVREEPEEEIEEDPRIIPKERQQMVIEKGELVIKEKPVKIGKPKTIIPRNLMGVFLQPDQPGAAKEERRV